METKDVVTLIFALISGCAAQNSPERNSSPQTEIVPVIEDAFGGEDLKMCVEPPMAGNVRYTKWGADFNKNGFLPGTKLIFYCIKPTWKLVGQSVLDCAKDGRWYPATAPQCYEAVDTVIKSCREPYIEHGTWQCVPGNGCEKHLAGSEVEFTCQDGYHLSGETRSKCLIEGRWSPVLPHCLNVVCPALKPVRNGSYKCITENCMQYGVSAMLNVVCVEGYDLSGTSTLSCRPDGRWSSESPECIPLPNKSCGPPYKIQHGQWTLMGYDIRNAVFGVGTTVQYRCESGYKLVGEERLECVVGAYWSAFPPICQPEILCADPGMVQNGRYQCSENTPTCLDFAVGSVLMFICDEGYTLDGYHEITCTEMGKWSSLKPICRQGTFSATLAPLTGHQLASTTTVVIATACSVLGLLMVIMLVVAVQRRQPQTRLCHPVTAPPPPPYSPSLHSVATSSVEEHDRVALIAYADGLTLPSYEEAVRSPSQHRPRIHIRAQPDAISRHSILTNSTMNRDALSAFGSLDTVNLSTDGTSTTVTVDTYDSGASVPSLAISRRAAAGSLASTSDTNSLHKEESPLLEQVPDVNIPSTLDVELEEIKND